MIAGGVFHVGPDTNVVVDVDARCGRDWTLTVQAEPSVRVRVLLQWAGGERQLANLLTVQGPNDIALPQRMNGDRLEVELSPTPGAFALVVPPSNNKAAVCLSWTPDCQCHPAVIESGCA